MIKVSMMYNHFVTTVFLGALLYNTSFGQLYNPDPYKIKFDNLDIEHTKNEIVHDKIKKISSEKYQIEKGGAKNEIAQSDFYTVEFNEAGNPVKYRYKDYRSTSDPEYSVTFDYVFEYDTSGKLIHVQEYEFHTLSPGTHYEKDVYFVYDKNNNLIEQTYLRKYIFDPGYRFTGRVIPNDTSTLHYVFEYDDAKRVTIVFRKNYTSHSEQIWLDTLTFNCSFDSVFIDTYVPKGIKKDSEGRMIESTRYARHVLLKSGVCISPDSPSDVITKYYYNDCGKLIKSQSRSRKGKFLGRRHWTYNEKGLLQSIQVDKSDKIIVYAYEFY